MKIHNLEIRSDLDNRKHEPHLDVTLPLPEIRGAEHLRIRPDGSLIQSETCVGRAKMPWEPR